MKTITFLIAVDDGPVTVFLITWMMYFIVSKSAVFSLQKHIKFY